MDENTTITNEIIEAITGIFGEYEPIERTIEKSHDEAVVYSVEGSSTVQTVTLTESETVYEPNWTWFVAVACFIIILYSFLRAAGGLLKCKI